MPMPAKHVIIQANGLFGNVSNWKVINQHFQDVIDREHYLIHSSAVNEYRKTFEGIDVCGERLSNEIKEVVQANPTVKYISLLGHSMGGLLIRYAAGKLFDADTNTVAGLQPIHFICMATPHLGCDSSGEGQVPFVGWMFKKEVLEGGKLDRFVSRVTRGMFKDAGKQLFLEDRTPTDKLKPSQEALQAPPQESPSADNKLPDQGDREPVDAASTAVDGTPPLIAKLVFDVPGEGLFYSSLKAFQTRTCYGNADNDHVVGWANSTLRYEDELPDLKQKLKERGAKAKGVVYEDPVECSWLLPVDDPPATIAHSSSDVLPVFSSSNAAASTTKEATSAASASDRVLKRSESKLRTALMDAAGALNRASDHAAQSAGRSTMSGGSDAPIPDAQNSDIDGAEGVAGSGSVDWDAITASHYESVALKVTLKETVELPRAAVAAVVLARMRNNIPWARVDCAWQDSLFSMFAHNNIQGKSVCAHLAKRFSVLEDQVCSRMEGYCTPSLQPEGSPMASDATKAPDVTGAPVLDQSPPHPAVHAGLAAPSQ